MRRGWRSGRPSAVKVLLVRHEMVVQGIAGHTRRSRCVFWSQIAADRARVKRHRRCRAHHPLGNVPGGQPLHQQPQCLVLPLGQFLFAGGQPTMHSSVGTIDPAGASTTMRQWHGVCRVCSENALTYPFSSAVVFRRDMHNFPVGERRKHLQEGMRGPRRGGGLTNVEQGSVSCNYKTSGCW